METEPNLTKVKLHQVLVHIQSKNRSFRVLNILYVLRLSYTIQRSRNLVLEITIHLFLSQKKTFSILFMDPAAQRVEEESNTLQYQDQERMKIVQIHSLVLNLAHRCVEVRPHLSLQDQEPTVIFALTAQVLALVLGRANVPQCRERFRTRDQDHIMESQFNILRKLV